MVAARRIAPATRVALPSRTARAWWRTHSSAAGSPSWWKHQAAFQMYSRTWMKSITMVMGTARAWASAVIRSIWWLLPSTRATQVRSWSGSRRSASAKIWATTDAASATTLAVSHLFDVTGPGLAWARSVSSAGRMSALARRAAVASNTAPSSAIRFRFRFSPFDSRVASFGRVLAAAAADGRPECVVAHHDTFAVAGQHERVAAGAGWWLPLAVEPVGVDGGSAGELFDLPFADPLSGAPFDCLDRPLERPT